MKTYLKIFTAFLWILSIVFAFVGGCTFVTYLLATGNTIGALVAIAVLVAGIPALMTLFIPLTEWMAKE